MVFHDRRESAFAGRTDRCRSADHMAKVSVVADIQPGIDAGLDKQIEVRSVVPGEQRLSARCPDLADVG